MNTSPATTSIGSSGFTVDVERIMCQVAYQRACEIARRRCYSEREAEAYAQAAASRVLGKR